MSKRDLVEPININLGGEERELKVDLAAMCDFERATGKTVVQFIAPILTALKSAIDSARSGDVMSGIEQGVDVIVDLAAGGALPAADLTALLWACLGGEDSGLTQREAGRLVDVNNIVDVAVQIYTAVAAALPTSKGGAAESDDDSKNAS